MRRWLSVLFSISTCATAMAQKLPMSCATGDDTTAAVRRVHEWNRQRTLAHAAARASSPVQLVGNVFVIPKSAANTVFDHPNDLAGKSVSYVPAGPGYVVTTGPLQYDPDLGAVVMSGRTPSAAADYFTRVDLQSIQLPLFGRPVATFYVSLVNGITLDAPQVSSSRQLYAMDSLLRDATIAPLLMTTARPPELPWPTVFVNEKSDGVTVTWRATGSRRAYDVQARITTAGEIIFSYRRLDSVAWGSAIVNAGASALSSTRRIATADDPAGDLAAGIPDSFRGALDLRSIDVMQVSGSTLLELDLTLAATPSPSLLSKGDSLLYDIVSGGRVVATIEVSASGSMTVTSGPVQHRKGYAISGRTISVLLLNEDAGVTESGSTLEVRSSLRSRPGAADSASVVAALPAHAASPFLDLSAAAGVAAPPVVVETFTLPVIDLAGAWEQVRSMAGLSDEAVDAAAVWQDFDAEQTISNVAFAAGGNPGVDGISEDSGFGSSFPRSVTLLNMSGISTSTPVADDARVLMHEFGHRWLFRVRIEQDGASTRVLDPVTAHPAQYVHAQAAFPVLTPADSSVMGGGTFTDRQDGTFVTSPTGPYGFSWLDLYLMGLASPDEIPPWFYVQNSNPSLGLDYWPPGGLTVSGTRRDVSIAQVIAAMGDRRPAAPSAQRQFVVCLVMLSGDPASASGAADTIGKIASTFLQRFVTATGSRGSAMIAMPQLQPPRRHAAGR